MTLWDTTDPARPSRLTTLSGPGSTVYALAFSPDQQRLAAADADGTVYRWNVTDGAHPTGLAPLHAPGSPVLKTVAYSRDGRLLAAAGAGVVAVWHGLATTPQISADPAGPTYSQLAFNPAGTLLAAAGSDSNVYRWTVAAGGVIASDGTPLATGTAQVDSLAISPDGTGMAAGAADGSVHIYDTATGKELTTLAGSDPVTAALFLPDGQELVTADSAGTVRLWPLPAPTAATAPGNVYFLNWLDGGRTLMATAGGPQGRAVFYDLAGGSRPVESASASLPSDFGPIEGTATPTPGGRFVAAADKQGRVEILDVSDRSHPRLIAGPLGCTSPLVEQLSVTLDGRLLVSGDDSGKVCVWDITDRSHPRLVANRADTKAPILGFAISGDGRMLATGSADGRVRLYRLSPAGTLAPLATVGGFSNYALTAAFTPDGRTLIAGSADGTIRLWSIVRPDRPEPLGPPLSGPTGYVYQLAVSPDGRTLAAATTNHAVWLWDISRPSRPVHLDTLQAAGDAVFAVRFSPDGRTLAASGSDRVVHLWNYQPARAGADLCAAAGQAITRQEWSRYIQGAPYRPPCR